MSAIVIRAIRAGDGEGCARAWSDAGRYQRDLSRTRLTIDALAVADDYRRKGVGTALMKAAEEWGRGKGATVATTDTNVHSAISLPFYEERMGYDRRAVVLRKPLR